MEMKFENPFGVDKKRPYIIAGPCSAETEQQVLGIAKELKDQNIDMFRAGIWKPRTKPGSFEGVGALGLKWLRRVKEETGLKVTTEVANRVHVDECLYHGIDALWIGARTTVNPFSVQDIADALQGVDIPVMVKNPINADLKLWIGGIERIYKAGIRKIAAIHRGFSSFGETNYRNAPTWQIPIELKRQFPDLLVINDNSHICGRRDILKDVAQVAMDLNFDGLMTEVHTDPDNAWSDAAQQITPKVFGQLVRELVIREKGGSTEEQSDLSVLRSKIDVLDDELLRILDDRMKLAEEIGRYKKAHNISILQPDRWNQILVKSEKKAENLGLSVEFINTLFRSVHQESINHQEEIMK
ncbi:bifunctional 3-deoxy-7-phosphoheptulonate synthase/chorismate mutase type II [Portibacter marinus]|uniref:bifunctional 3-deoxy-7-phosphoheptulonate synthase/chorismate mutase type II n=1 Tax=Portibacter marinus TaxID=2898660 RepID=UPI001F488AB7|nr:bifunctional 3-deoxy-7-phosphoheptulonate synthase/chorismate mutase type II [Portibacter marinus]